MLSSKTCPVCKEAKPLEQFHRSAPTKDGRHSYCASCACKKQRESRKCNYSTEQKSRWQRKSRYNLTQDQYDQMLADQYGRCKICTVELEKIDVDHCHNTGVVRGLLCRKCNLRLGGWDDLPWRAAAMRYLGITAEAA